MGSASSSSRWLRGFVVLALLGATLGVLLDGIHSHFGATSYAHPVFFRAAWWVPPLFAGAFASGLLRPLLERALGKVAAPPAAGDVLLALGIFVAAYWLTVAPLAWPIVAAALLSMFAFSWWRYDRSPVVLGMAVAVAFIGPAIESLLVSRGLFVHHQAIAFGVPGWLPFLYLNSAVPLCGLAKRLVDG
ncbi:MAG TPA: hypothetical protein VKE22_27470 [Haliangiales bacterium]|nr:hypothetical protein [Haliangiales bacterium]